MLYLQHSVLALSSGLKKDENGWKNFNKKDPYFYIKTQKKLTILISSLSNFIETPDFIAKSSSPLGLCISFNLG